jgi:hypothetical protein
MMKTLGCNGGCNTIDRRGLLTRTVPACAVACLGLGRLEGFAAMSGSMPRKKQHKFDVPEEISLTPRQRGQMIANGSIEMIGILREELGDAETIRLLNVFSAQRGRQAAARQAASTPQNDFQSFVQIFRSPQMQGSLTLDIVEDTEKVFALEVRECLWAEVFKAAGLEGEIGHAAVCNMDYHWPPAFNPAFKMERDKTLMQGHDICNHRYIDTA